MVSLGDVWEARLRPVKRCNPIFEPFKNQSRNRSCFLLILEAKMLPKSIPKSYKTHPQSHPETKHQKTTKNIEKLTKPNLENQALVYTRRLFSLFHRLQKYRKKLTKILSKMIPKSIKNQKKNDLKINKKKP